MQCQVVVNLHLDTFHVVNDLLCHLVPDSETLQAMIRRERKLRLSPLAQRAYSLQLASRRDINRQIRLRVVREFNLPDSIAEELESAAYQFAEEADESQQHQMQQIQQQATSALIWEPRKSNSIAVRVPVPPKRMTSRPKAFQKSEPALDLPMDDDNHQLHQSQLSEFIPDIAALSINPLPHFVPSLQPPEPYRYVPTNLILIANSRLIDFILPYVTGNFNWI